MASSSSFPYAMIVISVDSLPLYGGNWGKEENSESVCEGEKNYPANERQVRSALRSWWGFDSGFVGHGGVLYFGLRGLVEKVVVQYVLTVPTSQ